LGDFERRDTRFALASEDGGAMCKRAMHDPERRRKKIVKILQGLYGACASVV
jgi:hypothetical protein